MAMRNTVVKYIKKGDKGDPAVNIIVSSDTVVFTKSGQGAIVSVEVYMGEQQLTYGDGQGNTFLCSALSTSSYLFDGKVRWGFRVDNDNKTFKYLLNLQEKADISETVAFTVTVNGVVYNKSITFKTVYDGVDGTDGQNSYNFALTQDNIVNKKSEYSSTYQLSATLYDGTQKVNINDYQIEYSSLPEGVSILIGSVDTTTAGIDVAIEAQAIVNSTITLNAVYEGVTLSKTLSITTVEDGVRGERGATLRGPQDWNKLGVGYQFYSGGKGEKYLDVVVYENNYYLCKESHVKTEDNYPTSTVSDNKHYWQLGDKIDLVATKVLLSEYICVEHLGAEAIEMKDKEGNLVFFAKDGNVTCKTGTFENVNISGYLYKSKTVIDDDNLDSYLDKESPYAEDGSNVLDLKKAGTWIEFQKNAAVYIVMPSIYPEFQAYTETALMQTRSMIGDTVIMYNKGKGIIQITGRLKPEESSSGVSLGIKTGQFISLTCMATATDGKEDIYWLYRIGQFSTPQT